MTGLEVLFWTLAPLAVLAFLCRKEELKITAKEAAA
jgi:hypothetical protein